MVALGAILKTSRMGSGEASVTFPRSPANEHPQTCPPTPSLAKGLLAPPPRIFLHLHLFHVSSPLAYSSSSSGPTLFFSFSPLFPLSPRRPHAMSPLQNQHDGPQITLTDAASASLSLHPSNTTPKDGIPPTKHEADAVAPMRPFAGSSDPFASPTGSRPSSPSFGSSNAPQRPATQQPQTLRYFHSRLVKKGEVEKSWLGRKDPKEKWVTILPLTGIFIGLALAAFLVWDGLSSVVHHKYCLVLDESFDGSGLDSNVWTQEVQVGGFG